MIEKINISKIVFVTLLVVITCSAHKTVQGQQRFKAAAVLGGNFSQIDGDDIAGYDKLGLSGGFKVDYPVRDNVDASLEMLYNAKGSTPNFAGSLGLTMQYLDVPLTISIKDWYQAEADYHKVSAHAGLSLGYLFGVSSSNPSFSNDLSNYNQVDFGYLLGVSYRFTKRLGLTIRHTRAFTNLLATPDPGDDRRAVGYFVTARTEFYF